MNASQLNHRIEFYELNQQDDGAGGTTPKERAFYKTNASVKPLKQLRTTQGNQETMTGGYEIYINWRPDKQPKKDWYIIYKGKKLVITSVTDVDEMREWWLIIAMEA